MKDEKKYIEKTVYHPGGIDEPIWHEVKEYEGPSTWWGRLLKFLRF